MSRLRLLAAGLLTAALAACSGADIVAPEPREIADPRVEIAAPVFNADTTGRTGLSHGSGN